MFETIKEATRHMARGWDNTVAFATSHKALYGYLGLTCYLGCIGVMGKDQVAQISAALYFFLSAR